MTAGDCASYSGMIRLTAAHQDIHRRAGPRVGAIVSFLFTAVDPPRRPNVRFAVEATTG
jgi:hypothetical protein